MYAQNDLSVVLVVVLAVLLAVLSLLLLAVVLAVLVLVLILITHFSKLLNFFALYIYKKQSQIIHNA